MLEMEHKQPLLSICIPTNGIVEWVVPVIDSIYNQGVDDNLFEVVITDNGSQTGLQEAIKDFPHPNFHYYKTKSKGFTNQIDAFEKCNGFFCKMLNHRSKMIPGSIDALLHLVKKYKDTKPIIYCAGGNAKGGEFIECNNTDEFVRCLGVWTSWSSGTGAWKDDLNDLRSKPVDSLFSHMLFLFDLREESKYVIWNGRYEIQASDKGKGGYDIFYAFSVRLLDILSNLRQSERISNETFVVVKKEVLSFLSIFYYRLKIKKENYTFILQNVRQSISIYYGDFYYFKLLIKAWAMTPKGIFKKTEHNK